MQENQTQQASNIQQNQSLPNQQFGNPIKKELIPLEIENVERVQINRYQSVPFDEKIDMNIGAQTKVVLIVASSLFFLGFNRAMVPSIVNSATTKQFQKLFHFQISAVTTKAILSGITPLGAIFGTIVCSFLIKRYSARQILFNAAFLAIIATITTLYTNIIILIIFKFVTGWCNGTFVAIIPSYIKEITSKNISPYFGTAPVINESLGGFMSFVFGFAIYQATSNVRDTWVIMCMINIIPLIVIIISVKFQYIYQSPIFLLRTSQKEEARRIYEFIYQQKYVNAIIVQKQLQIRRFYFSQLKALRSMNNRSRFFRKDLFIAVHLPILRKMTGVLVIVLSSGSMLKSVHPEFQTKAPMLISLVYFISCFLSNVVVKTLTRRQAFQLGTVSICICNLVLAICYIAEIRAVVILVFSVLLLVMYGMTIGPLVWAYLPEVVPARVIPIAQSMNWLIDCFTLPLPGVIIAHHGNPWPLFFTFFLWDFFSIIINHFILVETKRKNLDQIIQSLDSKIMK